MELIRDENPTAEPAVIQEQCLRNRSWVNHVRTYERFLPSVAVHSSISDNEPVFGIMEEDILGFDRVIPHEIDI